MGNLVFGSGAEPGCASKARGGLTESPMERDYDATESDKQRYKGSKSGTTETKSYLIGVEAMISRYVFKTIPPRSMTFYHETDT